MKTWQVIYLNAYALCIYTTKEPYTGHCENLYNLVTYPIFECHVNDRVFTICNTFTTNYYI